MDYIYTYNIYIYIYMYINDYVVSMFSKNEWTHHSWSILNSPPAKGTRWSKRARKQRGNLGGHFFPEQLEANSDHGPTKFGNYMEIKLSLVVSTPLWNTPQTTFTTGLFEGIPFIVGERGIAD